MSENSPHSERPLSIAVVGTGISGLSAAWLLSRRHPVTVYEKEGRVGGHSNTVEVDGIEGPIAVDTGFIVYNTVNYPNLTALFAHLGVATRPSTMSFAASLDDGALEYSGSDPNALFAQRRNLVRPRFWRMLGDIRRFYRGGPGLLDEAGAEHLSLGAYLERERFSGAFVDDHLLPMAAAIWSTPADDMLRHPAVAFVRFCLNHGLMRVSGRPQWRTVVGGSREYVRRLTASFENRIVVASPVSRILRTDAGVLVRDARGNEARYDHVVLGCHADESLAVLGDAAADERAVLGAFRYTRNEAVLHTDTRLMPRRRSVWSSWNYIGGRGADRRPQVCVTYWMNRLQGLDPRVPLFVTLNPHREIAAGATLRTFTYDHPSYDAAAYAAQGQLWRLQGQRNTWFCGSYHGDGFHEDGLQAGLAVAEALGGVRRPWSVAGESSRIRLGDRPQAA